MNRKAVCLILTLALTLTCAACSKKEPDVAVSGSVSESSVPDTNPSGSVTAPAEDKSAEEETEIRIGSVTGGNYRNEYFGVACDFSSDWTFYTDEELATLYSTVVDLTNDEEVSALLEEGGYAYDMFAYADSGLVTVNAVIEKLSLIYGVTLSEEEYAQLSMDNAVDGLNSIDGYAVQSSELTTITFAGAEHSAIRLLTTYTEDGYDYDLYQLLVCVKNSNYVMGVTFTSYIEDITDTLAEGFYAIEG